jgi:radical SAM superfamily enzyme YgiQ (UPF0313 family)
MKTVLIATHQISFSDAQSLYNCLGVLTLAACLKKRQLDCEVLDLFDYNNLDERDCDEVIDSIVQKILSSQPDILGFSAMINNLPIALELASRIKQIRPGVFIIFGGPGTAFCAKDVLLKFPQVDVIFRGEADVVFPDYVESLCKSGIENGNNMTAGLIYRTEADIVDNGWPEAIKDLNNLPVPDYHFDSESYISQTSTEFGDYNGISVEVGRGCPFTCTFCSTSEYFKRKYRLKTVSRIIEEILTIQKRLGPTRIIFNHDLLTLKRKFVFELCEQIKTHVPDLVWKCHARLDTLDRKMLATMNEAGCNEIFTGLESATEKMQKIVNKRLDVDKFDIPLDNASFLNMRFSLSFIVGFPEEEDDDTIAIFAYAIKAKYRCRDKVQIKIHTLAPLVGSPLYEKWKNKLEYDTYGSIGTTDIPFSWQPLREMIKPYPEIFSIYFHLPIGETKRINSSKFGYLGLVIEKLMVHSILLAYECLGDSIADIFVRNIDQVNLPPASSLKNADYYVLAESVRKLIADALRHEPGVRKMYETMAQYEIAVLEASAAKGGDFIKIIEVYYNPNELLEQMRNAKNSLETDRKNTKNMNQKRYFMIFKDKSENKMKNTEISRDFAELMNVTT